MEITNCGQLREMLANYPDEAPLECQVVATEGGAWKMFLGVYHGADLGFKWFPHNPLVLQMSHPSMKKLPEIPEGQK